MRSPIGNTIRGFAMPHARGDGPGVAAAAAIGSRFLASLLVASIPIHALANPTGPQVRGGSATITTAGSVMTVTSPGGAMIDWQGFAVGAGETVRYVQPEGSTVINRVTGGSLGFDGSVQTSGRVLFLRGGSVSGAGVSGDLGVMTAAALRTSSLAPPTGVQARDLASRAAQALKQGQAFVIGPRGTTLTTDRNSNVMLAPGRGAELGDKRLPFVRVLVVAPADKPLDLDALVAARPNGIFNALFLPPVPASSTRQPGEAGTAIAAIGVHVDAPASPPQPLAAPEPVVIEIRMATLADAPEERALMAELAPVEDRAGTAVVRAPAPVEDRLIIVWAAPVEERAATAVVRAPAPVEDRVIVVWAAPVEDRVAALVLRQEAPVEERALVAVARDPAPAAARTQVAPRGVAVPEIARAGTAPAFVKVASSPEPSLKPDVPQAQPLLLKVFATAATSGELSPKGIAQSAPVLEKAVLQASATAVAPPAEQPVRLAAIQRRMPRILIDYRGGVFHM